MMVITRLSFKEMCARFDVTARTLRYYDYIELLSPERQGRSRFYGPREIARMTLIRRARGFGFSLEEIRRWLQIYTESGPRAQLVDAVRMIEIQIDSLTTRRHEIDRILQNLNDLRRELLKELA